MQLRLPLFGGALPGALPGGAEPDGIGSSRTLSEETPSDATHSEETHSEKKHPEKTLQEVAAAGHAITPDSSEWVFVRRPRARRYILRVDADGRVRVTIPRGGSKREADAFARRHGAWIARQRAALVRPRLDPAGRDALRRRASDELPRRLHELAARHGLSVSRVSIRDQRSRWGSCGRDGHICVNWRLVLMPDAVRDYVLIHELMHLRRMDHSPAFWRLVAAACPDVPAARAWLRQHGPSLR